MHESNEDDGSAKPDDAEEERFLSVSGKSGMELSAEQRKGRWISTMFIHPLEPHGAWAAWAMAIAIKRGARWLVCYADPLLIRFLAEFDFRPVKSTRVADLLEPPPDPLAEMKDAGFLIRRPESLLLCRFDGNPTFVLPKGRSDDPSTVHGERSTERGESLCLQCGTLVSSAAHSSSGWMAGYACARCHYIHVSGSLVLPPFDWAVCSQAECEESSPVEVLAGLDTNRSGAPIAKLPKVRDTERVVIVFWLDLHGAEQRFEVAGWTSSSVDAFAEANLQATRVLGQIFVERPATYLSATQSQFLTSVDLRSSDGQLRMVQEFDGDIRNPLHLSELLRCRLGEANSDWQIVDAHIFKRPVRH